MQYLRSAGAAGRTCIHERQRRRHLLILVALFVVALVSFALPQPAFADDEVELNEEQLSFNNKAIAEFQSEEPDPEAAIRYVKAALLVGPKGNVLYLTLGRAYQLAGDCENADKSYNDALDAPPVKGVKTGDISARVTKYRREVQTSCAGSLEIECNNPNIELSLKDHEIVCNEPIDMQPGTYTINASLGEKSDSVEVEVLGMAEASAEISIGVDYEVLVKSFEHATSGVKRAANRADDAQDAEFRRMDDERRRAEREALEAEKAELAKQEKSKPAESAEQAPTQPEPEELSGWHMQVGLMAQTGGYAAQRLDGAADGGLTYGGTGSVSGGYGFSRLIAVEQHLQVDYVQGHPLGLKLNEAAPEEDQEIGMNTLRLFGETRAWLTFFSPGLFVDYRAQTLSSSSGTSQTNTLTAGPSLSIATSSIDREGGYVMFTGRWAPLVDGANDLFSIQISGASSFALFSLEYSKLLGEGTGQGVFRRGESLAVNLGFRIPISF